MALGDNFYYNGVTSVDDKRFKETFEDVFKGDHLKSENFFRVVAGNHDHYVRLSVLCLAYTHTHKQTNILHRVTALQKSLTQM